MRNSGRVNVVVIVGAAFLVGLLVMSLFSEERPGGVASKFMAALSNLDAEKLADLSYAQGESRDDLLEQWTYMTDVVAKEYTFTYVIKEENKIDDDTASVWMMFTKHAGMSGSYEERFELPLIKTEEGWRVDLLAVSRDFIPGLPR